MKKHIYLVLFLATLCIPSCNKDKSPCTNCPDTGSSDCEDIQNVKNFFAFKVGSWWVYEEETSGARDSVYVTQYQNDPSNYNFDVRVYSTYQDYYYHYWPTFAIGDQTCNENEVICKRCLTVKHSKYKPGDFVDESRCFFFIPKVGDFSFESHGAYPDNKMILEDLMESASISNFEFGRTIVMFEENSLMEFNSPTKRTYSENIGMVRREILDSNQIWNLIDYHIE